MVVALLLDHRLGNAQRIDTVAQRAEILGDRIVRQVAQLVRLDHRIQHEAVAGAGAIAEDEVGVLGTDQARRSRAVDGRTQHHRHALSARAITVHRLIADVLLAQQRADIVRGARFLLVDGVVLVHVHQEMHATLQVEAQRHRTATDCTQPCRHARLQVEHRGVVVGKHIFHGVRRVLLRVVVGRADQHIIALGGVVLDREAGVGNVLLGQRIGDLLLQRRIHRSAVGGRYLHRRRRHEYIR